MIKKYKTSKKKTNTSKRIMGYTALGAALTAAATDSKAQIIYTDVVPDQILIGTTFDIDFDGDGTYEFQLNQNNNSGLQANACQVYVQSGAPAHKVMASTGPASYLYPLNLAAGAPIAASNADMKDFSANPQMSFVFWYTQNGTGFGNFVGQGGYFGFQFVSGAGTTHTGWAEIECSAIGDTLTLKSYAYEATAGTTILAGATASAVNEIKNDNFKIGEVFPNPLQQGLARLPIISKQAEELSFELFNGIGDVVRSQTQSVNAGRSVVTLDYSDLASGSYFIKITGKDFSTFKKLNITK